MHAPLHEKEVTNFRKPLGVVHLATGDTSPYSITGGFADTPHVNLSLLYAGPSLMNSRKSIQSAPLLWKTGNRSRRNLESDGMSPRSWDTRQETHPHEEAKEIWE